ncbi:ATP-binding cassette domain-containing protein [Acidaminococcus intestini]|nr:ATP-binding cassette domain-containing protein [Acidaminococcus intestini]
MIEFKHLSKRFSSASGMIDALQDVNLSIADGDIFGVIGFSGAGKSTLLRMVNRLEDPTEGKFSSMASISWRKAMMNCGA